MIEISNWTEHLLCYNYSVHNLHKTWCVFILLFLNRHRNLTKLTNLNRMWHLLSRWNIGVSRITWDLNTLSCFRRVEDEDHTSRDPWSSHIVYIYIYVCICMCIIYLFPYPDVSTSKYSIKKKKKQKQKHLTP